MAIQRFNVGKRLSEAVVHGNTVGQHLAVEQRLVELAFPLLLGKQRSQQCLDL